MTDRQQSYWHLLGLFGLAITFRLLYLQLASDHLGFEQFANQSPDSRFYRMIADHILGWEKLGGYGLLRVGPGYALILAGIKAGLGSSLIWPILFNIVIGGLAPVFIYILAFQLLKSRTISLLAGTFSAVSLTSISLSCHILTDQPYFTIQVAAIVVFLHGYVTGRTRWFLLAGVLSGWGAYVRPAGQTWPYIFMFLSFVLPVIAHYKSRRILVLRTGITGAIMFIIIMGWSVRNYVIHDLFTFGTNGMLTVNTCLVAEVAEKNWGEGKRLKEYREEWEAEDGVRSANYAAAYDKARIRIIRELKARPGAMLREFLWNIEENAMAPNYAAMREIPQMSGLVEAVNNATTKWLGYTIIILTTAGVGILIFDGRHFAAWLLGIVYLNYTVLIGASIWQGSRLHYPAEMAWSIVLAYLAVKGSRYLRSILGRLRPRWRS